MNLADQFGLKQSALAEGEQQENEEKYGAREELPNGNLADDDWSTVSLEELHARWRRNGIDPKTF